MAEVTRSNSGGMAKMVKALADIDKLSVRTGWFPKDKYENGTPVAYVAALQEFGNPATSLPARPFMRPAQMENRTKWMNFVGLGAKAMLRGEITASSVMGQIGAVMEGDVKQAIVNVNSPALSPITIMARKWRKEGKKITGKTIGEIASLIAQGKGDFGGVSTKPLIDNGLMVGSVSHEVRNDS